MVHGQREVEEMRSFSCETAGGAQAALLKRAAATQDPHKMSVLLADCRKADPTITEEHIKLDVKKKSLMTK